MKNYVYIYSRHVGVSFRIFLNVKKLYSTFEVALSLDISTNATDRATFKMEWPT
jgi:hypothetical protein